MLAWADHRTLIACHCLLALVLAAVLAGLRRTHRDLIGVGSMALGFLFGVPATALVAVPGIVSSALGGAAINACVFLCYIFLYRGIRLFCRTQFPPTRSDRKRENRARENRARENQTRGNRAREDRAVEEQALSDRPRRASSSLFGRMELEPILWVASACSLSIFLYLQITDTHVALRVAIFAASIILGRVMMAATLLRYANGRIIMVSFAVSILAFALLTLWFAVATIIRGTPENLMEPDSVRSITLLVGFLFMCINASFFVAMVGAAITRNVESQAHLDYLTGTMNRGGIEKALVMEIARTRRSHRPFALLLIDVDRFKQINDLHGHAAGDEALRIAARAIGSALRSYDKVSRYGGDEFLALLSESSGLDAVSTAVRIRAALLDALEPANCRLPSPPFTLSIGVTHCTAFEEPIDILARADSALYQAKRSGRDCVRLHLPESSLVQSAGAEPELSA